MNDHVFLKEFMDRAAPEMFGEMGSNDAEHDLLVELIEFVADSDDELRAHWAKVADEAQEWAQG
jgi:hypothetical protein